jgi:hypothetical protein
MAPRKKSDHELAAGADSLRCVCEPGREARAELPLFSTHLMRLHVRLKPIVTISLAEIVANR